MYATEVRWPRPPYFVPINSQIPVLGNGKYGTTNHLHITELNIRRKYNFNLLIMANKDPTKNWSRQFTGKITINAGGCYHGPYAICLDFYHRVYGEDAEWRIDFEPKISPLLVTDAWQGNQLGIPKDFPTEIKKIIQIFYNKGHHMQGDTAYNDVATINIRQRKYMSDKYEYKKGRTELTPQMTWNLQHKKIFYNWNGNYLRCQILNVHGLPSWYDIKKEKDPLKRFFIVELSIFNDTYYQDILKEMKEDPFCPKKLKELLSVDDPK